MWLREREWQAELLDDPGLNEIEVRNALDGLQRLNCISRGAGILWAEIARLARSQSLRGLRVLDLACGGGDIALALMKKAANGGLALSMHACDRNARSLEYARRRAITAGLAIEFFAQDVLNEPLPAGYDVVMCSLFLHHLQERDAITLLSRMSEAAQHLVLVNDLKRSMFNYVLVLIGSRLLSRSPIVHADAVLSMKNAFTAAELAALAETAGLKNFSICTHLPARMMLCWEKP